MVLGGPCFLTFETFLGLPCVMTLRIWQLLLIHIGIVWIDMMQTGNCSPELLYGLQVSGHSALTNLKGYCYEWITTATVMPRCSPVKMMILWDYLCVMDRSCIVLRLKDRMFLILPRSS